MENKTKFSCVDENNLITDKEFITQASENQFVIDLGNMILYKESIVKKYDLDFINSLERNSDDYLKKLIQRFDLYILHIIEEIVELSDEYDRYIDNSDDKQYELVMYEIIDVVSYISSLLYLMKTQSSISLVNYKEIKESVQEMKVAYNYDENVISEEDITSKNFSIKEILFDLISTLILEVRRNFPERKYHKQNVRILSINDLYELFNETESSLIGILLSVIKIFMILSNNNFEEFNEMYFSKGNKVLTESFKE